MSAGNPSELLFQILAEIKKFFGIQRRGQTGAEIEIFPLITGSHGIGFINLGSFYWTDGNFAQALQSPSEIGCTVPDITAKTEPNCLCARRHKLRSR